MLRKTNVNISEKKYNLPISFFFLKEKTFWSLEIFVSNYVLAFSFQSQKYDDIIKNSVFKSNSYFSLSTGTRDDCMMTLSR